MYMSYISGLPFALLTSKGNNSIIYVAFKRLNGKTHWVLMSEGCNGLRDVAEYVSLKQYGYMEMGNDLRYLEEVGRVLGDVKRDPSEKRTSKKHIEWERRIRRHGWIVRRMPVGMERRELNTGKWDDKRKQIFLTVEWNITSTPDSENASSTPQNSVKITPLVPADETVGASFSRAFAEPSLASLINDPGPRVSENIKEGERCFLLAVPRLLLAQDDDGSDEVTGKNRKREDSDLLAPATKEDQEQSQWQPEGQRTKSYPNQNMSIRVWGTAAPSHNFQPPQLQPQIPFVTQNAIQPLPLEPFMQPLLPPGHELSYPFHHRQFHAARPAVPNLHVNPPANLQVNPPAAQLPAFVPTNHSIPDLSPRPSFSENKELPKPTFHILSPTDCWLVALKGKMMVEFPTVLVVATVEVEKKERQGEWVILRAEVKEVGQMIEGSEADRALGLMEQVSSRLQEAEDGLVAYGSDVEAEIHEEQAVGWERVV
ncbi:hypothetical protein BT69DRAFT_1326376 [Atractiella rhizophila]|nr:hypothetical protein BT69DRAFT_1326376 [Atractiella rhizophila]